jgi:hypothetical protein
MGLKPHVKTEGVECHFGTTLNDPSLTNRHCTGDKEGGHGRRRCDRSVPPSFSCLDGMGMLGGI